jgi:hypothetical protein
MFAGAPSVRECHCLDKQDAQPLILEVCQNLGSIPDEELVKFSRMPAGFEVSNAPDVGGILFAAKTAALEYVDLFGSD